MENNSICLLDIEGVDHTLPANPKNFKQLQVKSIMEFPPFMAAIKRLTRVNSSVRIDSTNIIDTPRSVSYEGQVTTGLALTIGGWIDYSVEFLTDDISESLCTLNTDVKLYAYASTRITIMFLLSIFLLLRSSTLESNIYPRAITCVSKS